MNKFLKYKKSILIAVVFLLIAISYYLQFPHYFQDVVANRKMPEMAQKCIKDFDRYQRHYGTALNRVNSFNSQHCNFVLEHKASLNQVFEEDVTRCLNGDAGVCFDYYRLHLAIKQPESALVYMQKACDTNTYYCGDLGHIYVRLGDGELALQSSLKGCDNGKDYVACYNAACAYCLLNKPAQALTQLKMAILNLKKSGGKKSLNEIKEDLDLSCIHHRPELAKFLR